MAQQTETEQPIPAEVAEVAATQQLGTFQKVYGLARHWRRRCIVGLIRHLASAFGLRSTRSKPRFITNTRSDFQLVSVTRHPPSSSLLRCNLYPTSNHSLSAERAARLDRGSEVRTVRSTGSIHHL